MPLGPVEYIIVGFDGNEFTGDIVPALVELVETGTVRILDLVVISKDAAGNLTSFEYDELDALAGLEPVAGDTMGLLNDEDLEMAAETLGPNSTAAFLVWEDRWATRFADAVRDSGGTIIAGERIPHAIVEAAVEQSREDDEA